MTELATKWLGALQGMVIRHPNPRSKVVVRLTDGDVPHLYFGLDVATDTTDPNRKMKDFAISTVSLTYWPGIRLARAWVAAAWGGYCSHEALEMVTVGDLKTRPLDPHERVEWDRGLRDGLPVELTPETLLKSLAVVMQTDVAERFVQEHGDQ